MGEDKVSALYDEIWGITQKMVDAAKGSDWDELVSLERVRSDLVAKVTAMDLASSAHQDHIKETIQQTLACDVEIRALVEAGMAELQGVLSSVGNERKLSKVYGPGI